MLIAMYKRIIAIFHDYEMGAKFRKEMSQVIDLHFKSTNAALKGMKGYNEIICILVNAVLVSIIPVLVIQ